MLTIATNDTSNNTEKNISKFCCEICDFNAVKLGDYKRHLSTRKHQRLTLEHNKKHQPLTLDNDKANVNLEKPYTCDCGKSFAHRPSLSRHKKNCTYDKIAITSKNEVNDEKEINAETVPMNVFMQAVNSMKETAVVNQELMKKIVQLSEKPSVVNNVKQVNNITNFNLHVFLNETCKDALNITDFFNNLKLQMEDLENLGKLGYVEGMSNIIIKNLEELEETQRPIHCVDLKRDVLYIKDNDGWEKNQGAIENLDDAMEGLQKKNVKQLQEWTQQNPAVKNPSSQKADQYHRILGNMFGDMNDPSKDKKKIIRNIAKNTLINKDNAVVLANEKKDD
jgi:hypothetical protein